MECLRDRFYDGVVLNGRFETVSPLNHGSFGMVFMAKDLTNGEFVAIKCLTKKSANSDVDTSFAIDEKSEELACHARLGDHPNTVNLIHSFETDAHLYIVLEFCSRGDLYEAIRTGTGPLETERVRQFMLQLVDAVAYIHSKGMYHRDIKPENIFLTQAGEMKLGDFGLATSDDWTYETTVGSDRYMSPEQYDSAGAGYAPAQADVWAIGICLLNILFSRNPFTTPTESDPLFLDFSRDKQSLFDVFPTMSQDTYEVIAQCMSLDPRKRSLQGAREALERVISFTTFDESLDDFDSAERRVVPSANREPLRTPSIQSPQMDQGSFPWAKALHASPPQQFRQLSAIPDDESYYESEDLFPNSEESGKDWFSHGQQTPSMASVLDSAFGASMHSMKSMAIRRPVKTGPPRAHPAAVSGSLPINMSKPKPLPSMESIFGKKDVVSKSWGDLWDEDEEEEEEAERQLKARQMANSRTWSHESKTDDDTIVRGPLEPKSSSLVNIAKSAPTPTADIDGDIVADGFFFHETPRKIVSPTTPARYSPPSKRTTFDKWSALGERRRAHTGTSESDRTPELWRKQRNVGLGFTGFGAGVWDNKVVNTPIKDKGSGGCPWVKDKDRARSRPHNRKGMGHFGDLEWVGGFHDLHL